MRELLSQIRQGLDADLYFLSLYVALAVPDLCGALSSENGEADGGKYKAWFNEFVAQKYGDHLDGDDCYYFRCSLLHQGSSRHSKSTYERILFIEPSATTNIFHNNIMGKALNIDVRIFCNDIIESAETWLDDNENTELYKKNYDKFMRRYPDGLKPYLSGIPVIS